MTSIWNKHWRKIIPCR